MCLLGQNVNSYRDLSANSFPLVYSTETNLSKGFSTIYHSKEGGRRFADLLYHVSTVSQCQSIIAATITVLLLPELECVMQI